MKPETNNEAGEAGLPTGALFGVFHVEPVQFPNLTYRGFRVRYRKTDIGNGQVVDGGYLVGNHRKPVATLQLAVKQMIDDKMNACRAAEKEARKLMEILRKAGGPIPPNVDVEARREVFDLF